MVMYHCEFHLRRGIFLIQYYPTRLRHNVQCFLYTSRPHTAHLTTTPRPTLPPNTPSLCLPLPPTPLDEPVPSPHLLLLFSNA